MNSKTRLCGLIALFALSFEVRANTNQGRNTQIVGGTNNTISTRVTNAVIVGGQNNSIATGANNAVVAGGNRNIINSAGKQAFIAGGQNNLANGLGAFAAGNRAQAEHNGAFVWADSQSSIFRSTTNNQFLIRAQRGVGINTNNPGANALSVRGNTLVTGNLLVTGSINGLTNFFGPQGPAGARGPAGPQGAKGNVGPVGPVGPEGPQGEEGLPGEQGPAGADGAVGATGPTGPQGEQGLQGPQGLQGEPGLDGAVGATGPVGPQGEQGLEGPEGPQGPAGTQALFGTDTNQGAAGNSWEGTMGQIILSAGSVVNGLPCNGQILSISQYSPLFALLGTKFGGDGSTTFALPDLRDVAPNGLTYSILIQGVFPSRRD